MPVVYSECVLEVGDSAVISLRADMLTSTTDKCMRSSVNIRQPTVRVTSSEAGIHRTNTKSQTNVIFCQKES